MSKNYDKIIYYMVLAFAFSAPLSRSVISAMVILLPLLWLKEGGLKEKYKQIISNKFLLSLGVFLIFTTLSILWSNNIQEALNSARLGSYLLTTFVIATKIKKEHATPIITAFLSGMFISEVIAYGVFFELWTFKDATVANPSPFMFWIDYSVFMAFAAILLLHRVLSNNYSLWQRVAFGCFFLSVVGNLFLASGRTGQVAFVVAIIALFIMRYKATFKSILMSLALLVAIFTSAYNLSNTFKHRSNAAISDIKNIMHSNLNSSWGIRVAFWITSFDVLKSNPIIGVGIGDYKDATKEVLKDDKYSLLLSNGAKRFMDQTHMHNNYLLVLVQMGLVGLFIFASMIYSLITLKIEDKEIKQLSLLFVIIFFVSCFAEPLLIKQFTIALFVIFAGVFAGATSNKINKSTP